MKGKAEPDKRGPIRPVYMETVCADAVHAFPAAGFVMNVRGLIGIIDLLPVGVLVGGTIFVLLMVAVVLDVVSLRKMKKAAGRRVRKKKKENGSRTE